MEMQTPVLGILGQSSPFLKPNLSAVSQWRTSRAAQQHAAAVRFIFVGNQPKIINGEAMELWSWFSRIMDPDELLNLL